MDNKLKGMIIEILTTAIKKINKSANTIEMLDDIDELLAILILCIKLSEKDKEKMLQQKKEILKS